MPGTISQGNYLSGKKIMKKLIILLFSVSFFARADAQQLKKVLFLGNS